MSNSKLISYTRLSPNHSGKRNHVIDTISIHCMAGNLTVETCGALFANKERQASSNYGIGSDGRIGLYVDEANRSWCTSSGANDHRAITIEVANCKIGEPWPITDAAYKALIDLLVDICQRNNIKQLLWRADKSLIGQVNLQNMTVHRWFANKSCPGNWLFENHGKIAAEVNARVGATHVVSVVVPSDIETLIYQYLKAKGLNDYAIAGIMGNMYAECGLDPTNLQNNGNKTLGVTDAKFTAMVDNGKYDRDAFIHDKYGYGLCQWTYWSRKQGLYDLVKSKGTSIGDATVQLDYFWYELTTNYKSLYTKLQSVQFVREASNLILLDFEAPASKDTKETQDKRAAYSQGYYDKFVNSTIGQPWRGKVNTPGDVLNCRKEPIVATDNIVMTYQDGTEVTIIQESNGWGFTGAGWVSLNYITKIGGVKKMDQDTFNKMFNVAMTAYRKERQDNDAGGWSAAARQFVEEIGLFAGSGKCADGRPNFMWEDMLTREQMAQLMYRLCDMIHDGALNSAKAEIAFKHAADLLGK